MEYSAVTQPLPEPLRHSGTDSSTDAVHNTRVRPVLIMQQPSAYGAADISMMVGLISDGDRSCLTVIWSSPLAAECPWSICLRGMAARSPYLQPLQLQSCRQCLR